MPVDLEPGATRSWKEFPWRILKGSPSAVITVLCWLITQAILLIQTLFLWVDVPENFGWIIWPNPSTGRFKVGIGQPSAVSHVVVYNEIGQPMYKELVNNRGIIEMYIRTPGTYVVGLISTAGYRIVSKKVVIKPY